VEYLEMTQSSIFSKMGKELDALRDLVVKKVKTLGAREHVEEITKLYNSAVSTTRDIKVLRGANTGGAVKLDYNRVALAVRKEVRSALELSNKTLVDELSSVCTKRERSPGRTFEPEHDSSSQVLEVLADVQAKLVLQDSKISAVMAASVVGPDTWTEVVARRKKSNLGHSAPPASNPPCAKQDGGVQRDNGAPTLPSRRSRLRHGAVLVMRGDSTFADVLKRVKSGVNTEVTGTSITKMRETRNGDLLIEVRGDAEVADTVRKEVERSCGSGSGVQLLERRSLIEIRDLDCVTCDADVVEAVGRDTGARKEKVSVLSLRKAFGGTRTALVLLPQRAASKIADGGRMRVGLVYCRARSAKRRVRCYKCLAFGHNSRACGGTDRSECYRRYGVMGHFAKSCSSDPAAASEFQRLLDLEPRTSTTRTKSASPTTWGEAVVSEGSNSIDG